MAKEGKPNKTEASGRAPLPLPHRSCGKGRAARQSLALLAALATAALAPAQRATDALDRGLVAIGTEGVVFCSWRIPAEEYYGVGYNIYRDGVKLNDAPLAVSNFTDGGGTPQSRYSVEPVVRGVPGPRSKEVAPWASNFMEIKTDHGTLASNYAPNDACMADVDGDGELEILIKFDNLDDAAAGYPPEGHGGEYTIAEVYKLDGRKLWWLEYGPNIGDYHNTEINIVAYDWDGDGRAEALVRAADGTVLHTADGKAITIGDPAKNYRTPGGQTGHWFIHEGDEFLLYLDGATGEPYQITEYPLRRLEEGETDLKEAWGDDYGHRATKHFFGAPFLDGRHPSIFLARGIYTRHKMVALDVDPLTHQLRERWRWTCNTPGSPWYGQGYHNFGVADVDWDGRDEIVFGSMVIDDCGRGLSTTGLGHGDAQHCGDFDPYSHGQEIFACNENNPNNNFRDATTSRIYYRSVGTADDGRANMANFIDAVPGAEGVSAHDGNLIGAAAHAAVDGIGKQDVQITQNFPIYWDGDLCAESFDYRDGKDTEGHVVKPYQGEIAVMEGSMTNNDTKGTACFQGDILGDWREEVVMRTAEGNIRIYTTDIPTPWRNYTLWHDHQYRQAMVWQTCGYNQPPHPSYYLGEMEGITIAPPPLTMAGRTEIANGSAIGKEHDGLHIMMCETGDMTVSVADGASPYVFTDNAPTWVEGHDDNDNISTTTYTHTLTGGGFAGETRLVKQGDGTLVLPGVEQAHTGPTEVWAGTLRFDGTMPSSRVWLNRFASLESDGGRFPGGIEMEYGATLRPGGAGRIGAVEADSLLLGFGACVEIDIDCATKEADFVKAGVLAVETEDWKNGPARLAPVLNVVARPGSGAAALAEGRYKVGQVGSVEGSLADIAVTGLDGHKGTLALEGGTLYLDIEGYAPGSAVWKGTESNVWDTDRSHNFADGGTGRARAFVPGDSVTFDDSTVQPYVTVSGSVAPAAITFANQFFGYTLSGDSIEGNPPLLKTGFGSLTIGNANHIGRTTLAGGRTTVASLAGGTGSPCGSLGQASSPVTITGGATLAVEGNVTTTQDIFIGTGGCIEVADGGRLTASAGFKAADKAATLTKKGKGTLALGPDGGLVRLVVEGGAVEATEVADVSQMPDTVELRGGSLYDSNTDKTYSTNAASLFVPRGRSGSFYADPRCEYTGSLTGGGTLYAYAAGVRNYFAGDWSQFEGTVVAGQEKRGRQEPTFLFDNDHGMPGATLRVASGTTFDNLGHDVALGALTGNGTLTGSGTYTVGLAGGDFSFGGLCRSALVKRGAGTMTFLSPATLAGGATVEEGTLRLAAEAGGAAEHGPLAATGSSRIEGGGTFESVRLEGNAQLRLQAYATGEPSAMSAKGDFTAGGHSAVVFAVAGGGCSTLDVGGRLSLDSIAIELADGFAPEAGLSLTLWNCRELAAKPSAALPPLPAGLGWRTDGLASTQGTLHIVATASAIADAAGDEPVRCEVFNAAGTMVGEFAAPTRLAADAARKLMAGRPGAYIVKAHNAPGKATALKLTVK